MGNNAADPRIWAAQRAGGTINGKILRCSRGNGSKGEIVTRITSQLQVVSSVGGQLEIVSAICQTGKWNQEFAISECLSHGGCYEGDVSAYCVHRPPFIDVVDVVRDRLVNCQWVSLEVWLARACLENGPRQCDRGKHSKTSNEFGGKDHDDSCREHRIQDL